MTSTTPKTRLFGTDGIRGRFGEGPLSLENVSALGRAVGTVFTRHATADGRQSTGRALVGHDGRRSGPPLEAALTRGLAVAGFRVDSAGLIPTPGLAFLGRARPFDLSVMISASHNPASDNGIKIFGPDGEKLPDEVEDEIEEELARDPAPVPDGPAPTHEPELEDIYFEHLLGVAEGLKLDGLAIVLDCANGAGSRVAPRILGRLGAQVIPVACEPDGDNINQDCGSTHPANMQEAVRLHGADLGIALDGDGDRCLMCDETSALVNGDGLLTLLASHGVRTGTLEPRRIVATVMSNRGLHRALREAGVEVETVGVGDRRVVAALRKEGLALGGEQSGHIVFGADNDFIGDGIYTALRCLAVIRAGEKPLSELVAAYRPFPQVLVNVQVSARPSLTELPPVAAAVRRIEDELGDDGRVLLRYSGTEPLARIMVEGPDDEMIRRRAHELAGLISQEIGA